MKAYEIFGREFGDGFVLFDDFFGEALDEGVEIFLRLSIIRIVNYPPRFE